MTKIAIAGCCGRMGKRLAVLTLETKDLSLASVFERVGYPDLANSVISFLPKDSHVLISDKAEKAIARCDIVIDFTFPEVTMETLKIVKKLKKKIVIGTTGFTARQITSIKKIAQDTAVVFSPNMSVGVNLLFKLSRMVAKTLSDDYDVEIVECHHKHKKDAPSGTAARIAELVAEGREVSLEKKGVYGRKGFTGERERGTIGVHAVRGGDVVGDHLVSFLADGERFELGHKASSRDSFAKGALVAARFLARKRKGFYTMQDVLGL